jgi:CheY-like chemotaxis protein
MLGENVEFVEDEKVSIRSVSDMLRATGLNTSEFMQQVAAHVEFLEMEVTRLQDRVNQLEAEHAGK